MEVWAADCPEEDNEADQATDDDALPEEDTDTSGNRGKSASSHPLRDWDDDDDEVMVLEPLDVVPVRVAPP
jgi:hypothetical protein